MRFKFLLQQQTWWQAGIKTVLKLVVCALWQQYWLKNGLLSSWSHEQATSSASETDECSIRHPLGATEEEIKKVVRLNYKVGYVYRNICRKVIQSGTQPHVMKECTILLWGEWSLYTDEYVGLDMKINPDDDDDDDDVSWKDIISRLTPQTNSCQSWPRCFKAILQLISRGLEPSRPITRCLDDTLRHLNHM